MEASSSNSNRTIVRLRWTNQQVRLPLELAIKSNSRTLVASTTTIRVMARDRTLSKTHMEVVTWQHRAEVRLASKLALSLSNPTKAMVADEGAITKIEVEEAATMVAWTREEISNLGSKKACSMTTFHRANPRCKLKAAIIMEWTTKMLSLITGSVDARKKSKSEQEEQWISQFYVRSQS